MYLFTLDWPLEKKNFNWSTLSALCIQHKYVYMRCSSNKFKKKPTSNPLMDQLHQIFFEFISKLLVRCWECCAKCAVHCLSHDVRVSLELKEKKKKKRETNRFHVAGHLFCNWSQMTSKCGGPGPWRAMGGLALFLDMSPRTSPFFTPHSSLFSTDWDYGLPCLELHNFSLYLFIDYELWQKAKVVAPAHAVH